MPRSSRSKRLYERGGYWLDWDRRKDGALRTPYLAIFWYDPNLKRIRSSSTRTIDAGEARKALDSHYLRHSQGEQICPTCGQRREGTSNALVLQAITDYLITKEAALSISAIRPRLAHVVNYIATLSSPSITCAQVDEYWIARFREWVAGQPLLSSSGAVMKRARALSTIENSVIQLAAAINASKSPLRFKPIQTKELNNTPFHRLTIEDLVEAFRYTTDLRYPTKRGGLHRYLLFAVATVARPDAVLDFSTSEDRRQWNSARAVICLNPRGRRQTKKYRPAVIAPRQIIPLLDHLDGPLIETVSVRSAWDSMVKTLGWPRDGDGGLKLVRRSVAQLLRDAGTKRAWSEKWRQPKRKVSTEEIELQLGHRKIKSVSDLYAMFKPEYLEHATAALEGIIEAIEERVPNAFNILQLSSEEDSSHSLVVNNATAQENERAGPDTKPGQCTPRRA